MKTKKASFKRHFSVVSLAVCGSLGLMTTANVQADSAKLLWSGNGHSYQRFDNSTITWTDAKTTCESKGAHLATITSQGENDFITASFLSSAPGNLYALGASDAVQEGTWKWITGEAWSYTDWYAFSNSPNYNYLYTYYSYGWSDETTNNSSRDGYICEWSSNTFINTSVVKDLNANGKVEIASLYVDYKTGQHTVKINDSATAALLSTLTFDKSYTAPLGLVTINNMNSNGIPEIAVLNASNIVTIKDTKNNAAILMRFGTMVDPFGVPTGYKAKNISVTSDLNGNGSSELSIMGVNTVGKVRTEIRDSKTGQLLNAIILK